MDGARESRETKLILTPPPASEAAGDVAAPGNGQAGGVASATSQAAAGSKAGLWKGRRVKRFKLVDEIGEGAMGRVYVAEDTVLQRHVALKLLPARHRDGRPNHRTERLIREARSAASLEHPHAITIHEIDEFGGVHYIAMELADGGNLEKLVQLSGPMEIERACQLIAEAAEACHHAHRRGIIHRDIKPANLLLTRAGRCKVADFGLAAFDAPDDPHRLKCVGTPNFIPPEIALGRGAVAASDIYSLGCTLFYLLTGRPPFAGSSTRDVLKLHVKEPFPDIRKWRPDVPERLVAALEQACAKDPAARFADADTFAKVMRTFTIPTGAGSNPAVVPVASGPHMSGYVMMSGTGHLQPIPPPAPEYAPSPGVTQKKSPPWMQAAIWTGAGTVAATILIGIGIMMAKRGPNEAAAAPQASPPAYAPQRNAKPGGLFEEVEEKPAAVAASAVPSVATPAIATPGSATPQAAEENALSNGSISEGDIEDGRVQGWYIAERCKPMIRVLEESGNRFMRVKNTDATTTAHVDQKIDVEPAWKSLTVSARLRAAGFKPGKSPSGVSFVFQDDNGKMVGKFQPSVVVEEDTPWVDRNVTVDVPAGAKKLYLQCVVSYTQGTIDFDDVKVVGR